MLPNLGPTELIILLVIILLLFGAKRIPELAKGLGSGMREFRKSSSGKYDEVEDDRREEVSSNAEAKAEDAQDREDRRNLDEERENGRSSAEEDASAQADRAEQQRR